MIFITKALMNLLIFFHFQSSFVDYGGSWPLYYLMNRTCGEYLEGLKYFLAIVEADMRNGHKSSMLCPRVGCKNEKQYSNQLSVHAHLIL